MKPSDILGQHVVVAAFLALLVECVARFPFSGEIALLYFTFEAIVWAYVFFIVTIIPLMLAEALVSYLHRRRDLELSLVVKWALSLGLTIVTSLLFGLSSTLGLDDPAVFFAKGYGVYVPALLAAAVFRVFRHRRYTLG